MGISPPKVRMTSQLIPASAGVHGRARQDALGREGADPVDRDLVVAMDDELGTQFAEVLDEVVGEGVVVVDDEEHGTPTYGPAGAGQTEGRDGTGGFGRRGSLAFTLRTASRMTWPSVPALVIVTVPAVPIRTCPRTDVAVDLRPRALVEFHVDAAVGRDRCGRGRWWRGWALGDQATCTS